MTENTWLLLGFDARYNEQDLQKVPLSHETRETFFLNTDIENTLTVDSHMWPSHFSYYPEIDALLKHPPPTKSMQILNSHPASGSALLK